MGPFYSLHQALFKLFVIRLLQSFPLWSKPQTGKSTPQLFFFFVKNPCRATFQNAILGCGRRFCAATTIKILMISSFSCNVREQCTCFYLILPGGRRVKFTREPQAALGPLKSRMRLASRSSATPPLHLYLASTIACNLVKASIASTVL